MKRYCTYLLWPSINNKVSENKQLRGVAEAMGQTMAVTLPQTNTMDMDTEEEGGC